jgi:hypothetical protein
MKAHQVALALALGCAMPAAADCRWEWLCNGEGACKQMPVCGSLYDSPQPRPSEARAPAIPPLTMRVNTFSGRGVKPGTPITCEHVMRPDRTGRWYWTEACFCADPERTKDRSPPFANIVRCEEPQTKAQK